MLTIRGGIPQFAQRFAAGDPVTIVAYGTSLTHGGRYLAHVRATLTAAGNGNVTLVNSGLRGYMALWAAFRVQHDVVPLIIELFHQNRMSVFAIVQKD